VPGESVGHLRDGCLRAVDEELQQEHETLRMQGDQVQAGPPDQEETAHRIRYSPVAEVAGSSPRLARSSVLAQ